jgi:hypothetical protein
MNEIYTYYPELINKSKWGEDKIIIKDDINLLQKIDFNQKGYTIFNIIESNIFLKNFITTNISNILQKNIDIEQYHNEVDENTHKQILNSMPYKKTDNLELSNFCTYLEEYISEKINEKVKIFNDDIWIRICRPNRITNEDFNPCHKDIYLDFYRNVINIYLPIVGSNEKSSLLLQEGSHIWNENITSTTSGGAFFEAKNKKYSVDAIVQSKIKINMIRPNPSINEILLFSPYLIHGCSDNNNDNITRMSLEIRFIKDNSDGNKQEEIFKEYLKKRNWR